MFDLNFDNHNHHYKEANFDEDEEASITNTELSGTSSNSSVVNESNGGELEFFPRRGPLALFPVECEQRVMEERESSAPSASAGAVSDQLPHQLQLLRFGSFSSSSSSTPQQQQPQPSFSSQNQWLNLTVAGSDNNNPSLPGDNSNNTNNNNNNNGNKPQVRKSRRGPRSRSSQYRGVTFYRRTGRWESHIWDCGKQVYLGGFDTAHAAARAYDRAAIKFRGVDADINFNITDYDEDMKQMTNLTKEEFVHILRRQSTGFARGSSRYRGVTLHKCGRWEARMGQFLGKKAYDKAALQCNGGEAVTNFEHGTYVGQIPIQGNNGGGGHDELDLNLGISITVDGPKASKHSIVRESQTQHLPIHLANGKMPMNGSSAYNPQGAAPLYGQPLAPRQSTPMWSGFLPGRPGINEEKVSDQTTGRISNWAWYMQTQGQGGGGGGTTNQQVQGLLTSAASSGFSLSTTTANNSSLTFPHFPYPQTNNVNHTHNQLPPPKPSTSNSFQHYAQDR